MSDPYRTTGRNGPWFVDSDGDMIRMDRITYVHTDTDVLDGNYPVVIHFMDGTEYWITAEDGELLKKELLSL